MKYLPHFRVVACIIDIVPVNSASVAWVVFPGVPSEIEVICAGNEVHELIIGITVNDSIPPHNWHFN